MKNPYKNGRIHPSLSPPPPTTTATFLHLLPAAILSLAAALSPQDKEVLAYLISSCDRSYSAGGRNKKTTPAGDENHGPTFECSCFRCYMTFWARWDASSNRHVIDEIIEAYEEAAACQQKQRSRRSGWEKKRSAAGRRRQGKERELMAVKGEEGRESETAVEELQSSDARFEDGRSGGGGAEAGGENSAVRKIVSFVGDRIMGIFGRV